MTNKPVHSCCIEQLYIRNHMVLRCILSLCLLLCLAPGASAAERVTGTLERRAEDSVAATAKAIAAAVARELVETFAFAILYILIFVALVLLLRLAALAINLILRLPVLFSVNTFGGALLGLLEGMMVVWLLIWLAPRLGIALPAENTYLLRFFMTVGPLGLLSSLS